MKCVIHTKHYFFLIFDPLEYRKTVYKFNTLLLKKNELGLDIAPHPYLVQEIHVHCINITPYWTLIAAQLVQMTRRQLFLFLIFSTKENLIVSIEIGIKSKLDAKVRYDNQVFILQENSVIAAHVLLGNLG